MSTNYTYESLSQEVCQRRVLIVRINGIEVGGTYDPITKILVWQSNYAIRDEEYVRRIISGTIAGQDVL